MPLICTAESIESQLHVSGAPASLTFPAAPVRRYCRPQMAPAAVPPRGAAAFQGSTAALAASRACGSVRRAARLAATASLTYKEAASGIEFPLVQRLWLGEEMRCVGAGCRWAAQGLWRGCA